MSRKIIITDFADLELRIAAQAGAPTTAQGTGRRPSEPEVQKLPPDPLIRSAWKDITLMKRYGKEKKQ